MTHEMAYQTAGVDNTHNKAEYHGQYVQYEYRLAAGVFGREEE